MKEIDTIREAHYQVKFERISELMFQKGVPQEAFDLLADIHPTRIRNEALTALSTIDPDAKPQEDARKFAFDLCLNCVTPPDMNIDKAAALITAHDDAIRREVFEQIKALPYPNDNPSERRLSDIAAILGKEAEK